MSSSLIKAFTLGAALGMVFAVAPSCGTAAGSCDASSCSNGCCQNGLCLAGNSLTTCGKAGNACNVCSAGESCAGGACVAGMGTGGGTGSCSAANCAGCCFRGVCFTGKATDACGVNGAACNSCQPGLVCPNGSCITPPPGFDAGMVTADAGHTVNDAGLIDAGMLHDGGTAATDAGTLPDGGTIVLDAGHVTDAGATHDAGTTVTDAGGGTYGPDGGIGSNAPCSNAVGNDCAMGEACYVTSQPNGGFELHCLAQGTSPTGGTCTYLNDCSAGNVCLNGSPSRCYKLCSPGSNSCPGGGTCSDLGTQGLGYCTN